MNKSPANLVQDPVFSAFRADKSATTLNNHDRNLTLLVQFLVYCQFYPRTVSESEANLQAQVKFMNSSSEPWHLVTWGHLAGFKRWLTSNGHTPTSVKRVLATITKYQSLASQADATRQRTPLR